jgi:monoamine oxidase
MKHVLSLVSVVTEAAAFTFAQATDPVCIVGGLTVANKLQARGYETVIFEKDPEVGGRCKAHYDKL